MNGVPSGYQAVENHIELANFPATFVVTGGIFIPNQYSNDHSKYCPIKFQVYL